MSQLAVSTRAVLATVLLLVGCGASSSTQGTSARTVDPAAINVMVGNPLGEADRIGDFLGAGGGMAYPGQLGDSLAVAWRELGFRYVGLEKFDVEGDMRLFDITRGRDGKIRVGFDPYDRVMERYLNVLGARPIVYLGDIPRALSSQPDIVDAGDGSFGYSVHMPRDLKEWEELCAAVVKHNIERWGLRGLSYGYPGEPDYAGRFRYAPGDDSTTQLPNNIALYAATWRGVKSVDPTARLIGPGTMNWQITPNTTTAVFALADWIRGLAEYNATASEPLGLDFICWQDYAWSSDRISDGAEAVSQMLAENGFDPNTPKMLGSGGGWGSWSGDYIDGTLSLHRRGSHIAHNIIREFKDPRRRQFAGVLWYFFYTDDNWWEGDPENREMFRRSALVAFDTAGNMERTPMFAAFQMMRAMQAGGKIIESSSPEPIEVMAVFDGAKLIITINNHSPNEVTVPVRVYDAPFSESTAKRRTQVIDESNSGNGQGLQRGTEDQIDLVKVSPVTLRPYATVQLTLWK